MEVVITSSPEATGALVGAAIARLVTERAEAVLGLATGSSPLPVYDYLLTRSTEGLDLSQVLVFTLDEYLGLPADHPETYRSFIRRAFTDPAGVPESRLRTPDSEAADIDHMCRDFEQQITAAGGIDLQILGIGRDGHIGFNEPISSLASRTRLKTLTDQTRADNARFFGGDPAAVPRHVVTQGIGTILEARHCILIASGEQKAEGIAAAVEGPVSAAVPASALQLHGHVTVVLDEAAASRLTRRDYYRDTYANKPDWQEI